MWVDRLGFETAKRHLFTGDEIPAAKAKELGMAHELVDDDKLQRAAMSLAQRIARLPLNQLELMKMFCNQQADNILFDGIARHTPEGRKFVETAIRDGFRHAVAEQDAPFGDYGARGRSAESPAENKVKVVPP
jgi:enoyl-CoA hydratase